MEENEEGTVMEGHGGGDHDGGDCGGEDVVEGIRMEGTCWWGCGGKDMVERIRMEGMW